MKFFEQYKLFGADTYLTIVDNRQLYAGKTQNIIFSRDLTTDSSAEHMGPYRQNDPLLLLRELEKFERMAPPERGHVKKVFSNITRLRQGRKSWESHRLTNHDLLMERSATNMSRRELSVVFILDLAAAVMMILRHKKLSKQEGDLFPLNDMQKFKLSHPLNMKTQDPIEIIDQLILAIDYEIADGGRPKHRGGAFADNYEDDEDRCKQLSNHFYKFIANHPKKYNKDFYKKIGALFSAVLNMAKRNQLTVIQQILNKQQARTFDSSMTTFEKEQIIQRKEFPNHRLSIFTCIGFYESTKDENRICQIRDSITSKQCQVNKNAYKVIMISRFTILYTENNTYLETTRR